MKTEKIYQKYEAHTQKWISFLAEYDEKSFSVKPTTDEWSIAQVYDHITKATEKCLDNAFLCACNKGETGHNGFGAAIFSFMGAFPPLKLRIKKIPAGLENLYYPKQISKAEALMQINELLQKMKDAIPVLINADKNNRIRHWAGGWFNAIEWYHCAEMHLKHHFSQKKRIDMFIKKR